MKQFFCWSFPIPLVSSEIVVFHLPKGACSKDSAKSKRKSHLADQPLTSPRYPPRDPKQLLHLWSKKWTYYSSTGTRKSWAAWNKFLETVVPKLHLNGFQHWPLQSDQICFFQRSVDQNSCFFSASMVSFWWLHMLIGMSEFSSL